MRIYITKKEQFKNIPNSVEDQETTINISRGEDKATIWTNDNTIINKLSKMLEKNPNSWKCYVMGDIDNHTGYFFEVNKKCISFREGKERVKVLTEEHKQKMREGLKKSKENK